MSFSGDVGKWIMKVDNNGSKVLRLSAMHIFGDVIQTSIVGNPSLWLNPAPKGYVGGSYRANWQASINNPATSIITDVHKSTESDARFMVDRVKLGQGLYLVNNLPYARGIEEGTVSNRGTGHVRIAAMKWKRIVKAFAAKVNK